MLPPDKENKSIFSFIKSMYKSLKSLVKNPYDESMLKTYCSLTVEAMFYELIYLKKDETRFNSFHEVYTYLKTIYTSIIAHFKKGYYKPVINEVDQVHK